MSSWRLILGNTVLSSFPCRCYWCKHILHLSSISESSLPCLKARSGQRQLHPGEAKGSITHPMGLHIEVAPAGAPLESLFSECVERGCAACLCIPHGSPPGTGARAGEAQLRQAASRLGILQLVRVLQWSPEGEVLCLFLGLVKCCDWRRAPITVSVPKSF